MWFIEMESKCPMDLSKNVSHEFWRPYFSAKALETRFCQNSSPCTRFAKSNFFNFFFFKILCVSYKEDPRRWLEHIPIRASLVSEIIFIYLLREKHFKPMRFQGMEHNINPRNTIFNKNGIIFLSGLQIWSICVKTLIIIAHKFSSKI